MYNLFASGFSVARTEKIKFFFKRMWGKHSQIMINSYPDVSVRYFR